MSIMKIMIIFIVILGLCSPVTSQNTPLQLHLFDQDVVNSYGSRCLDGSPSGYYLNLNPNSTEWAFFLQGGGLCVEPIDCIERSKTELGTSTVWSQTFMDNNNILNSDPSENPFATWNHVYVPYCGGDVHTGLAKKENAFGLYFSGHLTLSAMVDHLINTTHLSNATRVLFSGASAGGIGTMQNADWMTAQMSTKAPQAHVVAAPQAGFYFPSDKLVMYPEFADNITIPMPPLAVDYMYEWFEHPYMDEDCRAHHPQPNECWSASVHYPYIQTPLFFAQNIFDQNQIDEIMGLAWWPIKNATQGKLYKEYFGKLMKSGMQQVLDSPKKDGLFLISCFDHTSNLCMIGGPRIKNVTFADSLNDWVYSIGKYPHQLVDDCGGIDPCNSHCVCH